MVALSCARRTETVAMCRDGCLRSAVALHGPNVCSGGGAASSERQRSTPSRPSSSTAGNDPCRWIIPVSHQMSLAQLDIDTLLHGGGPHD
jgi:hypothetical protein